MYSITAIFQKQPAVIAGAIRIVLFTLVLLSVLNLTTEALAGIAIAVEALLTLFVVSQSTSAAYPTLKPDTEVSVQGTTDKVVIAPTPPGPTGIEGG
jgi:hypothetical protein